MAFIPAPNTAQIDMVFMYNGQRCENVYHVQQETPYDQTSLAVLAALFKNWWDTDMRPLCPNTLGLVLIVARSLESESAPTIEYSSGLPIAGAITTVGQLPNNVTVAVKWTTALRGRSYRGRTFHLGLRDDMVTGNTVDPTALTALQGGYQGLIDDLDGLPGDLVVVSRYHNNAPRVTAVVTPVQGFSIDSTVDSQRRRLPGRGS